MCKKILKGGSVTLNRTYTYDGDGRMTKFGNDVVTYDSRGRISKFGSKSYTYDNYGNRTSDGTNTYTWVRGRLLSAVGGASFKYDVNSKRFSKTAGGVTATYYYDEDMLLGENRSDGKKLRYFYDSEGMCGFRYYNGSAWTEYVYVKNAKGDVLAILNGSGTVVANYSYDAWGNHAVVDSNGNDIESGIGVLNPFRYRGYYYDNETELYFLQTRYYDPEVGRFISQDSREYANPEVLNGINLYAYCGNNPVINVDVNGTSWESFLKSVGEWFNDVGKKIIMIGFSVIEAAAGVALIAFTPVKSIGVSLIATGVGSIIDGFLSEAMGGSFSAGWHGGQVGGLMSAIPVIGPALGAFTGTVVSDIIDNGVTNINWAKAGWSAGLGFIFGMPYGISSPTVAKTLYNFLVAKNSILTGFVSSIINSFGIK